MRILLQMWWMSVATYDLSSSIKYEKEQVVNLFHRKGPFEDTPIQPTLEWNNHGDTVINLRFQ